MRENCRDWRRRLPRPLIMAALVATGITVALVAAGCATMEDEELSEEDLALMTPAEVAEYEGDEPAEIADGDDPEAQPLALSCYATPWLSDLGSSIRFRSYGRCNQSVYRLSVAYLATRNGYYLANPANTCGGAFECYTPYRYFSDPAGSQQWCNTATTMTYCAGCQQVRWPQTTLCRNY